MANCSVSSADVSFALQVCPNIFDFSLQFEQLILSILPNSLIVVAAVVVLISERGYKKYGKLHDEQNIDDVRFLELESLGKAYHFHRSSGRGGRRSSNWYFVLHTSVDAFI
jgi:hypothetical protein